MKTFALISALVLSQAASAATCAVYTDSNKPSFFDQLIKKVVFTDTVNLYVSQDRKTSRLVAIKDWKKADGVDFAGGNVYTFMLQDQGVLMTKATINSVAPYESLDVIQTMGLDAKSSVGLLTEDHLYAMCSPKKTKGHK